MKPKTKEGKGSMKPSNEKWERDFDKKFVIYRDYLITNPVGGKRIKSDEVKDFIRQILSEERKRLVEEVRGIENQFEGKGEVKQFYAAEYMKYQILGKLADSPESRGDKK